MKLKKILILTITFLSLSISAKAQFNVNGEFRTRAILDHGYGVPEKENMDALFSIDQRSRLNIDYMGNQYLSRISFQDARVWGSDDRVNKTGSWGNSNSFGIHEAWVAMKFSENALLKVGRQEWNYDDMRIVSYRNWATSALSYDGILFKWQSNEKAINLDLGFSYNNNGNALGSVDNSEWEADKLKSMNFFRLGKKYGENLSISLIFSLAGKTDTSNNAILGTGTHGINFIYNKGEVNKGGVFGQLSAYYQHGTDIKTNSNGAYKDISAYLIDGHVGFRTADKKIEISLGAELISGHDYKNTGEDYNNTRHTFDLLYGGRLPYYGGNMNHFVVQDSYLSGTKGGGYFDPYIKAKYKINKKNIIEGSLFFPGLTTNVVAHTSINPVTKKPMGAEVDLNDNRVYWSGSLGQYLDLTYTYKINKEVILKAGMSYAFVSDVKNQMVFGYKDIATKELYNLGQNYFGWMILVVKPNFFNNIN